MVWILAILSTTAGRILSGFVALALVVGVSWASFGTYYYQKGWRAGMAAVAAQNAKAIKEANDVQKEVADCFASGGDWDIAGAYCLPGK